MLHTRWHSRIGAISRHDAHSYRHCCFHDGSGAGEGVDTHSRVGTRRFCREVWLQAASIGIEVSGYTPKPADLARLAELNGPTEHTRDRDSEHLALQPQAAAISAPGSVRDESPARPVDASVRHAKWEDDGIHLAVIVAAMREQGFSDRSVDRVKRRAVRMLDALHAEGVELPDLACSIRRHRPRERKRSNTSNRLPRREKSIRHPPCRCLANGRRTWDRETERALRSNWVR